MKVIEIGTGYTSIPAKMGAATEIVVKELTEAMIKQGADVEILDIKDKKRLSNDLPIKEVYVPSFLTRSDVSLGILHKVKRVIYSISLARKLNKIIKNSTEELTLHFHNQYNMFFFLKLTSRKLLKRVKLAYTVHSYIWNGSWEDISEAVKNRYFQEVFSVKNADMVFVLNDITKEHFTKHLGVAEEKIHLIADGVNTDIYYIPEAQQREIIKDELSLGGKKIFFQAGSVCPRKNQLEAVRLLTPIMLQDEGIVYVYAGGIIDEQYKKQIDDYAQSQGITGRVKYAGELAPGASLHKYYASAEAFIFPSKAEAFGMVILEAMSSGTPVLLEDGHLDLNSDLKENIVLYENPQDFLQKVRDMVLNENERNRISAAARKLIEEKYSWDAVADKYMECMKNA